MPPEPGQLFDADAGEASKVASMARVDGAASPGWKRAARISVRAVAERRPEFTTDAVWWWLEHYHGHHATPEPRAMGPVMRWAVTHGIVAETGRVSKSTREACHRRPLAVWESRVK